MVECYVVLRGRNRGIYPSWPLAAVEVIGFPAAIHQRYPTMEDGVQAWVEYFADGGQRVQMTGDVVGSVLPGGEVNPNRGCGGTDGVKADVGTQSETIGSVLLKAFGPGVQNDGGVPGKSVKYDGSSAGEGCSSQTHVSPSPYISIAEGFGTDGGGDEARRIMGAVEALEGRVSQLEMDKWELLMQLARLIEQMSAMMTKEKGK